MQFVEVAVHTQSIRIRELLFRYVTWKCSKVTWTPKTLNYTSTSCQDARLVRVGKRNTYKQNTNAL